MCSFIEGVCALYCGDYLDALGQTDYPEPCNEVRLYVDRGEPAIHWSQVDNLIDEVVVSYMYF